MARDRASTRPARPEGARPWWISPIFPVLLLCAGAVLLLMDGRHAYRIWWRRGHWAQVKGRLLKGYERRRHVRMSAGAKTPTEYVKRRPQRRIFEKVVKRGWPMSRTKRVWQVRVNYTYPWKTRRLTKVADSPEQLFEKKSEAQRYLAARIQNGQLRVWVNPKKPEEATAFLEYGSLLWVRLGFAATAIGLIWMIVSLVLGRSHRKGEKALEKTQ